MHIPLQHLLVFLSIPMIACGRADNAPSKHKEDHAAAVEPKPQEINKSEKHVLDNLLADARRGLHESDWTTATRAVDEGLKKTEDRVGLEIVNAHFLMLKGDIALDKNNEPDARRYFTDAMALFHVHKNEEGRFEAFTALGRLEARRGDYAAAERQFDQAEALRKNFVNPALIGEYLVAKGRLASRQMKRADSVRCFQEAITVFEKAKDKKSTAETLILLSFEDDQSDRLSAARRDLERAAALFEEVKDMRGKVRAIHRLAGFAEREKQIAKASRLYSEAAALYRSLGQDTAAAGVEMHLATLTPAEDSSKKKK